MTVELLHHKLTHKIQSKKYLALKEHLLFGCILLVPFPLIRIRTLSLTLVNQCAFNAPYRREAIVMAISVGLIRRSEEHLKCFHTYHVYIYLIDIKI